MPQGLFGNYVSFTFDPAKASAYIKGRMKALLKLAARAWVEEAKSRVPVWSGAERASLTNVAGYAGVPVFGPGRHNQVTHTEPRGVPNQSGRQQDGQSAESFQFDDSGINGKVFFRWKTSLFHFRVNEASDARNFGFRLIDPGPYNLKQHCANAVREAIADELKRNPFRFKNLFRKRVFKFGG